MHAGEDNFLLCSSSNRPIYQEHTCRRIGRQILTDSELAASFGHGDKAKESAMERAGREKEKAREIPFRMFPTTFGCLLVVSRQVVFDLET